MPAVPSRNKHANRSIRTCAVDGMLIVMFCNGCRRLLRLYGLRVPHLANIVNEELGGYSSEEQAFDAFMGAD